MKIDFSRGFLSYVEDDDKGPKGQTLAEHKKHCKAKTPDKCPFVKKAAQEAEKEDDVGQGKSDSGKAKRNAFGFVDTSEGYTVEDLGRDRPYLKKNNQATNGAFVDSGNAGGSRLDVKSVAAAHSSLEKIADSIRNSSPGVKGVVDSLLGVIDGMKNGKPVYDGGKPLTAKNFVSSMQGIGFTRGKGAKSAYYKVEGETTTRTSDHSATAELFVQDGTDNNLSIVVRRPGDKKKFIESDGVNTIEAVFPRSDLEANPEKLPQILRDIGEFIATGEYHDTAGALAYNFSGDKGYREKARDRIYGDALARGDVKTAQRMAREAFLRAFPSTKVLDKDGLPHVVYHGSDSKEFNVFDSSKIGERSSWNGKGFYFSDNESDAKMYGGTRKFYLNIENPFNAEDYDSLNLKVKGTDINVKDAESEISETAESILLSKDENGPWVTIFTSLDGGKTWDFYTRQGKVIGQTDSQIRRKVAERAFAKKHGIDIYHKPDIRDNRMVSEMLNEMGYDGTIAESSNIPGALEYVAYSPNQIKSADPVTYDDNGNVIPLSKRFDSNNTDIRY